jgi:hypothetical protein
MKHVDMIAIYEKALRKIAAYNDTAAKPDALDYPGVAGLDEPDSALVARKALKETGANPR